jgi:hypothetical protein
MGTPVGSSIETAKRSSAATVRLPNAILWKMSRNWIRNESSRNAAIFQCVIKPVRLRDRRPVIACVRENQVRVEILSTMLSVIAPHMSSWCFPH